MPRYIDTGELLKVPNVRNVCEYDETGEFISYKAVPVEAIENAPTIEAEPVRHGRWESYPDSAHIRCTCCKMEFDKTKFPSTKKYCNNCGAKMDGGKKDGFY